MADDRRAEPSAERSPATNLDTPSENPMTIHENPAAPKLRRRPSEAERVEMGRLGLLDAQGNPRALPIPGVPGRTSRSVTRRAITNHDVLNEAFDYALPSSFSRGLTVDVRAGTRFLWISGTASIDEEGRTLYRGDFRAQLWRTFRNITELLRAEGATWQDIVRTSCYLRDIERDYEDFNQVRNYFLRAMDLDPLPASTGIQARLCRSDLLIEIEAIAMLERGTEA
jgi:enamine deaminase RidA (YjgF/YER057c/UK114 family)